MDTFQFCHKTLKGESDSWKENPILDAIFDERLQVNSQQPVALFWLLLCCALPVMERSFMTPFAGCRELISASFFEEHCKWLSSFMPRCSDAFLGAIFAVYLPVIESSFMPPFAGCWQYFCCDFLTLFLRSIAGDWAHWCCVFDAVWWLLFVEICVVYCVCFVHVRVCRMLSGCANAMLACCHCVCSCIPEDGMKIQAESWACSFSELRAPRVHRNPWGATTATPPLLGLIFLKKFLEISTFCLIFQKKIPCLEKKISIFGSVIMRICCPPFFGSGRAANQNTFTNSSRWMVVVWEWETNVS